MLIPETQIGAHAQKQRVIENDTWLKKGQQRHYHDTNTRCSDSKETPVGYDTRRGYPTLTLPII